MLKVLYTVFCLFPRGPKPATAERALKVVRPDAVRVNIRGSRPCRALVMDKLGTIPEAEEVELPVFDSDRSVLPGEK